MELFEDGGLKDQGQSIDPVSGNDVPVGSTKKEVRDDVPAMLSEGEFVLPADVVRYIGLDNLMKLRQDAKVGLSRMNQMGQMGNSEQATIPDNLPYNQISPLANPPQPQVTNAMQMQMQPKMAHGGVLHAQSGVDVTGFTQLSEQTPSTRQPAKIEKDASDVLEGYEAIMYINPETKDVINILSLNGVPQEEVPEGYVLYDEWVAGMDETEVADAISDETTEAIPTVVTSPDDGGNRPPVDTRSDFQKAGGWRMDTASDTSGKQLQMWIDELDKVANTNALTTGIVSALGGGLMGGLFHLANKHQKKVAYEMIDAKIEEAKKTPVKGQVAKLRELKAQLEGTGEKKTILDSVVDTVSSIFDFGEEEKKEVKKVATGDTNSSPKDTDKETLATVGVDPVILADAGMEVDEKGNIKPIDSTPEIETPEIEKPETEISTTGSSEILDRLPTEKETDDLEETEISTTGSPEILDRIGEEVPEQLEVFIEKPTVDEGTDIARIQDELKSLREIPPTDRTKKQQETIEKGEEKLVEVGAADPAMVQRVEARKAVEALKTEKTDSDSFQNKIDNMFAQTYGVKRDTRETLATVGGRPYVSMQKEYEALTPAQQTIAAAADEQKVTSQAVIAGQSKDYDPFGVKSSTSGRDVSYTDSQTGKTETTKVFQQGESPMEQAIQEQSNQYQASGKKFDMNDPSTWGANKGGLARPVFKSSRKPDTTRGLAARKK